MSLPLLEAENFRISPARDGNTLRLEFSGSIHAMNPEDLLAPYLAEAMAYAEKNTLSVECNFVHLEYMNSASIPPLITLMRTLAEKHIEGTFLYDSSRKVQAASFRALDVIASKSKFTKVKGV